MKLTNKHGNYAKRIRAISDLISAFFNVPESEVRHSVSDIAPLVRYFKSDKIYLTNFNNKLEANTKPVIQTCNIVLSTYIENNIVCCEDYITLLFPDIETI